MDLAHLARRVATREQEACARARCALTVDAPVPVSNYGGLGPGLHRVHSLVEELGGRVDVESGPKGGALFVVRLPLLRRG